MIPAGAWVLLHLFFAFSFVGSLVVADWNGRAARASHDWRERALLFHIVQMSSRTAGLGSLVLLGVFGNLASIASGYSMKDGTWMRWVNGLWVAALFAMVLVALPNAGRLVTIARTAVAGGPGEGWASALARWRAGNILLSLLYLALLVLMVFRWRS